jgi:hypothetical protein
MGVSTGHRTHIDAVHVEVWIDRQLHLETTIETSIAGNVQGSGVDRQLVYRGWPRREINLVWFGPHEILRSHHASLVEGEDVEGSRFLHHHHAQVLVIGVLVPLAAEVIGVVEDRHLTRQFRQVGTSSSFSISAPFL